MKQCTETITIPSPDDPYVAGIELTCDLPQNHNENYHQCSIPIPTSYDPEKFIFIKWYIKK